MRIISGNGLAITTATIGGSSCKVSIIVALIAQPMERELMRRIQFRLWHLMSTVMIVASLIAGILWLFLPAPPPDSPHVIYGSSFWVTSNIADYEIPHTSPIVWVVTCVRLAAVLGIIAGLIVILMWAARTLRRVKSRSRNA